MSSVADSNISGASGGLGDPLSLVRKTGCVIVPITVEREPDWKTGPLSATHVWAAAAPEAGTFDEQARLHYFEPRVARTLYGDQSTVVRWHRDEPEQLGAVTVLATEVLRAPAVVQEKSGYAVFHVRFAADPTAELSRLRDLSDTAHHADVQALLPPGTRIAPHARARTLAHVTFDSAVPTLMGSAYATWPARDQWLWCLASATPESVFPPDTEDPALFEGRIRFSADWQALVLRDGVAFVGTSPDSGGRDTFHAAAETYVHTLYLDVLLLGSLHVQAFNTLANVVADLDPRSLGARRLEDLEGRLIAARRTLGGPQVTARGKGNEILRRFFDQHAVPELRSRLVDDLTDSARFVNTQGARSLNAVLGLITVLGLPFGLSYAAGAVWGVDGLAGFAACTAVAFLISCASLLLPSVRAMVRSIGQ